MKDRIRKIVARITARITAFGVLAAGWLTFLIQAYPGLMTRDSFDQLRQARTGIYLDDHPPVMQLILGLTDRILAGPFPIIMLQSGMLLAGFYLLLRRAMADRPAAITASALLWFPPITSIMTTLWKIR